MGIRGIALRLFTSYLTNRQIIVNVNGTYSTSRSITISVPQGSVIGPILYLLYVNDMCKLQLIGLLRKFADDTSTFYASNSHEKNTESIKEDMSKINEYYRLNKLTIDVRKTKYTNFGRSRTAREHCNGIDCEGSSIEDATSLKFLGLHIDNQLSWSQHIDIICARVSGAIGAFRKLNFLPIRIMRKLYYAIVHPHLEYAAAIWTRASQTHVKKLQVVQRMAIKCCYKLFWRHSTMDLFTNVAKFILPIKAIGVLQICSIVHAALHKLARSNLEFEHETQRSLRRARGLIKLRVHIKTCGTNAIRYAGPTEYDKLPMEIRGAPTLPSFKYKLKRYLLSTDVINDYLH